MTPAKNDPEGNNSLSSDNLNMSDITYSQQNIKENPNATIISASRTEITAGPLPHPRLLKEYDRIINKGAERIMIMAEKQQESRIEGEKETREINKHIADKQLKLQSRGQIIALIVILLIFGLVVLFTFTGHETVAYILLGIGVVGIITAFMGVGNKKKSDND